MDEESRIKLIERYREAYKAANGKDDIIIEYNNGWYSLKNNMGATSHRRSDIELMCENLEQSIIWHSRSKEDE